MWNISKGDFDYLNVNNSQELNNQTLESTLIRIVYIFDGNEWWEIVPSCELRKINYEQ
jgi:hypothetical protein